MRRIEEAYYFAILSQITDLKKTEEMKKFSRIPRYWSRKLQRNSQEHDNWPWRYIFLGFHRFHRSFWHVLGKEEHFTCMHESSIHLLPQASKVVGTKQFRETLSRERRQKIRSRYDTLTARAKPAQHPLSLSHEFLRLPYMIFALATSSEECRKYIKWAENP